MLINTTPFTVKFVGVINHFTAGPNQTTFCLTNITLTAEVSGDLSEHTIVWEQISGEPVTFTSPLNQLSITYTSSIFTDKSFRFYIDKGKTGDPDPRFIERFDEVSVFSTPAGLSVTSLTTDNISSIYGASELHSNQSLEFDFISASSTSLEKVTFGQGLLLTNNTSIDSDIESFIVQENTTGTYVDVGTVNSSILSFEPINPNSSYRVKIKYKVDFGAYNNNHTYVTKPLINTEISDNLIAGREVMNIALTSPNTEIDTYTVVQRTKINKEEIDTTSIALTSPNTEIDVYTVIQRTKINKEEIDTTSIALTSPTMVVDAYSVLDLTGQDIGG